METGKVFKELRQKQEMGQKEFADALGISVPHLSLIENGKSHPSRKVVDKLAFICDVPLEVIAFKALTRADVHPDRKELFDRLNPVMQDMLKSMYGI